MRRNCQLAAAGLLAIALIAGSIDASAQRRRTTTTTTTTSSNNSGSSSNSSSTSRRSSSSRNSGTSSGNVSRSTTKSSDSKSSGAVQQNNTTRRRTTTTTGSQSSGTTRQGNTNRQSATTQQGSTTTQQGNTTRRSTTSGSAATRSGDNGTTTRRVATRSASGTASSKESRRSASSGVTVRTEDSKAVTGSNVTRRGLNTGGVSTSSNASRAERHNENYRDRGGNYRYNDSEYRMDGHRNIHRIPPRERSFIRHDIPRGFFFDGPHYYGYRIHSLPPRYTRVRILGIEYIYYNDVYYRPYGTTWIICRPPHGTIISRSINRAILTGVTFAYYNNVYRTFRTIDDNYATIAEQNRIIAENNARIAAQNSAMVTNSTRATSAYEIANRLGLAQSYAYADSEYYYQDGVFYILRNGQYTVIVPPAGALVTSLPDDYDTVVMDGQEYYRVDNTVYRTTLVEGTPYLEVLGQMYGLTASKYSLFN